MGREDIKTVWTTADYVDMGWHDSRLHSVSFLDENFKFSIDLDYPIRSKNFEKILLPARMIFHDAFDISMKLEAKNMIGIYIRELTLRRAGRSPNGKIDMYQCTIDTDVGKIGLTTSGFEMTFLKPEPRW